MNAYPVIAWQNLLSANPGPEVYHSADAAGYPFANLSDWRDYTRWKSSETGQLFIRLEATELPGMVVTVDCLAVAGHNLASAGVQGLSLEYSEDDVIYYPCFEPLDPESDRVIFRRFPAKTYRYFQLIIPEGYAQPPELGVLLIGTVMEIPGYPDPGFDPDGQTVEAAAEESRTGRLLGVDERFRRREIKAAFSRLPAEFIEEEYKPFFAEHGSKPFFFAWDPKDRPEECCLVRLARPRLEAPYSPAFRSLHLELTGVVE